MRDHSRTRFGSEGGQATIEYALILAGFLALVVALGAIHSFLEGSGIVEHALRSSSHAIENVDFDTTKDIMSV